MYLIWLSKIFQFAIYGMMHFSKNVPRIICHKLSCRTYFLPNEIFYIIYFLNDFNCGKLAMNNKIVTTLCSSTSHGITWKTISSQNRTMKICKKRLWFMNLSLSRCVYDVVVIYIMAQVVCYSSGHLKETKTNSTKGLDILLHSKTYYCSRIIKM